MRILTPSEQREIEHLRNTLLRFNAPEHCNAIDVEIREGNREMWLNIFEMVLSTQEAMKIAWGRSPNPQIDLIQVTKEKK